MNTIHAQQRVFSHANLWMEGAALAQFEKSLTLPHMVAGFGLPDLHPGKGIPIGCCLVSQGGFYPHLAGNDLGCGMRAHRLNLPLKKMKLDALEKKSWLSKEVDDTVLQALLQRRPDLSTMSGCSHCFGSLGGGNHFAEILKVDESWDDEFLTQHGLEKDALILLTHTGSRSLGEAVARHWLDQFGAGYADASSSSAQEWLSLHNGCLEWAKANRQSVAEQIADVLGCSMDLLTDSVHNAISPVSSEEAKALNLPLDQTYFFHRKGAAAIEDSCAILPGSRGDYSWLLKPGAIKTSGFSLAHGAGRKWKRSDCKGRLEGRFQMKDFKRTPLGSRVVCSNPDLWFEEAPQAYKSSESVIQTLSEHGLAHVKSRLKPLLTLKV